MKTFRLRQEDIKRKWHHVDATGRIVGRLAGAIAKILMGKNKPEYSHDVDCGDYVVVTNCEKIKITGNKEQTKKYFHHSFYIGGLKTTTYSDMLEKHPDRILSHAVKGMLPKNDLQDRMLTRLRIFKGDKHTHAEQKPETLKI